MARAAVIPAVCASAADGPQQRSTRGRPRAAAADTTTTTAAKRGRKPGKTTATTTTTRRNKNKNDMVGQDGGYDEEEDDEDDDLSLDVIGPSMTAAKSVRSLRKAVVKTTVSGHEDSKEKEESDDDDDELAGFEVPRTRKTATRSKGKIAVDADTPTTATKARTTTAATGKAPRGRPKTVKAIEQEDATVEKKPRGRKPTAKNVNEKTIYITTAPTSSNLAKTRAISGQTQKKKVTFADLADSDGESSAVEEGQAQNVMKSAAKKSTAAQKPAGLKAKPVRKAGTATRGRPPKSQATKPLSPKKANQIVKASASSASSGEEDELASEKNIYSLVVQKSPAESQEHIGLSSPVKRVMLPGQTGTPARPTHATLLQDENLVQPLSTVRETPAFMGSPARRPPPSTSKETIRDTPRRGPLFISQPSASKLLSNQEASTFSQKISPLKASPKKGGNLGVPFLFSSPEKNSASSGTSFNAKLSLLQSPAKRVQSPFVFRKLENNRPLEIDDIDTEMCDDTFAHNVKAAAPMLVQEVADDLNDDEVRDSPKPVNDTVDNDDVFLDYALAQEHEHEPNDGDAKDEDDGHDQNKNVIIEDSAKEIQNDVRNEQTDDVHDPEPLQQHFEIADEDVVMSNEELSERDEGIEDFDPIQVLPEEFFINEEITEGENNIEPGVMVQMAALESTEKCELQAENAGTESTFGEDAEQATSTALSTGEPSETEAEVTEESNNIVIYAESDSDDNDVPEVETPRSNTPPTSARSSIDPSDIAGVDDIEEIYDSDSKSAKGTPRTIPPAAPSPPVAPHYTRRSLRISSFRDNKKDDTFSENGSSPASRRQSIFSTRDSILPQSNSDYADDTFTSLANKLSSWNASSPEKTRKERPQNSIFSPVFSKKMPNQRQSMTPRNRYSQIQTMRQSLAARHSLANSVVMDGDESDTLGRQSEETAKDETRVTSTEPGESKSQTAPESQDKSKQRLSMSITPVRVNRDAYRTVHTVSKVPLRREGDESPIKCPRKRARSMSIDIELPIRAPPSRLKLIPKSRKSSSSRSPSASPRRSPLREVEADHVQDSETHPATPSKLSTPPRDTKDDQQFLRGAVVFVDVHTTEGEDASGIFVELLTQMGAKCVKSWGWNGRSSQSPGVDGAELSNKVGITHVVYKDGGVRTLEKVRQAGDLVRCVGVGWVLDCERANKWIDEEHYYVDSTIIPRGGAKRRKSMQPRALANVNGSLMSPTSSTSSNLSSSINGGNNNHNSNRRSRLPSDWEDTVGDLRRMSPSNDNNSSNASPSNLPKTPTITKPQSTNNNQDSECDFNFNFDFDFSAMSPATPYFLSRNSNLTQQTCPPKQTNQGLFSSYTSKKPDLGSPSSSSADLRAKLEAARRKSLAYKPRFGSPLSRP